MPQPIFTLRENSDYRPESTHSPRYYASIDLGPIGVDHCVTHLPIHVRFASKSSESSNVIYSTLLAGLPIEHREMAKLAAMIVAHLQTLISGRRLPSYIYQIGQKAWPIYNRGSDLLAVNANGQAIRACTIGAMRMALTDYFMKSKRIQSRKDLHVLFLSGSTMQLSAASFMMRTGAGPDIPAFASKDDGGSWLLAPIERDVVRVHLSRGLGVFHLYTATSDRLIQEGKLDYRFRMTVRKLSPNHWGHIAERLKPQGHLLTYVRRDLPEPRREVMNVYTVSPQMLVAPYTNRAGSVRLYLGPDLEVLRRRLGQDLTATGRIASTDAITIVE